MGQHSASVASRLVITLTPPPTRPKPRADDSTGMKLATLITLASLAATPALAQHAPDDRNERGYNPAAHYRDGPQYHPRLLAPAERVYRGASVDYYCKRGDGTTGLIVGAVDGFTLKDAVAPGHSRTVATLIRDYIATLEGQAWYRPNHELHCR
jgi:hypothetical protein